MNKWSKFIKRLCLPKGFYELELEYDSIKNLSETKEKWIKLAHLCQRYNNGYLIAMSYGPREEMESNFKSAKFYELLEKQYRKKIYE